MPNLHTLKYMVLEGSTQRLRIRILIRQQCSMIKACGFELIDFLEEAYIILYRIQSSEQY